MQRKVSRNSILFAVLWIGSCAFGQSNVSTGEALLSVLKGKDVLVDKVLESADAYRLQLVYTPVREMDSLLPTIDLTSDDYFFPASTVKLPVALLALEKMKRLNLQLDDALVLNQDVKCGNKRFVTITRENKITFRKLFTELIVVSDNDFYNCLYHFVTPREINARLNEMGFSNVHIYKSFSGCDMAGQLTTNSLAVFRNGVEVYRQASEKMQLAEMMQHYTYSKQNLLGDKHEAKGGAIVDGPYDFNYNLEIPLQDLHEILIRLICPNTEQNQNNWDLRAEDRAFMVEVMRMFPRELGVAKYVNSAKYTDNIYKYILVGEGTADHPRTISKIGLSYGFSTETSYVVNEQGNGYFLTISMYTNANRIVNDGKYEYDQVARPFMARVGKILMELAQVK